MASENFKSSNLIYVVLLIILAFFTVFFKLNYTYEDKESKSVAKQSTSTAVQLSGGGDSSQIKSVTSEKAKAAEKKNLSVSDVVTLAGNPAQAELLTKWRESRGRYSEDSIAEYRSYDFETLSTLADNGDLKAMMSLADFYLSERNPDPANASDSAMSAFIRAAIYGSTHALENYSELYLSKVSKFGEALTADQMIEALAWKNVAALRGDMFPNQIASNDVERLKFALNEQSAGKISQRSQEIYAELQKERTALGLGDFDNSQSLEAKKFFSHLDNYMEKYNK